jgi:nucleoside-diphosphate-sugar epimerase
MGGSLLLTGADGFTGRHFLATAQLRGHDVYALQSDLTKLDDMAAELDGRRFDHVVHLAAISAVTHADELALYAVNLFGTLNLMQVLASLSTVPRKVLVASSANIYGNAAQSPISEQTVPAPVNHYAMSKLAMEYMLEKYKNPLSLIVVRPFNYTGPGQDNRFVIPKLVEHFCERKPDVELGNIDVEREFNDVRTVCDVYLGLLEHGGGEDVYNVCSGNTYSLTQVIRLLQELTGHELDVRVNPDFVRPDEVRRLCGDPARLEACLGNVRHHPLEDTLKWMLDSAGR